METNGHHWLDLASGGKKMKKGVFGALLDFWAVECLRSSDESAVCVTVCLSLCEKTKQKESQEERNSQKAP